jgi:metal-responsive CopG/Arc/MetJ family transcriptional regulator
MPTRKPSDKGSQGRKMFGIRLPDSLMKEIKHLAVDEGKPMNELVEEALRDLMKKYRENK